MLWEPVEPVGALRDRFGWDGLAAVTDWVTSVLDEAWGITAHGGNRVVISDQNAIVWMGTARGRLVVKLCRAEGRFAALAASMRVLDHLGRRGLPVPAPVPSLSGQVRITVEGPMGPLSLAVQPDVSGDWLDVADGAAVRAAGACLARLHEELRDQTDVRLPSTSRIEVSPEAVQRWLPSAGLPDLDRAEQLVHNDFRAANILTRGSVIVGVLDFDELAVGQPVGDLAYASVYLGTLFTDWRATPTSVRQQLRAGYETVRTLTPAEGLWYDALVCCLSQVLGSDASPGSTPRVRASSPEQPRATHG